MINILHKKHSIITALKRIPVCFFLVLIFIITAESSGQSPEDISFEHLTPRKGLSQSTVYMMLQDHEGYMWFATQDGLNKYDGYDMTVYRYNPEDTSSISYNRTFSIYEDRADALWIGTLGRGLNRYNREKDRFSRYPVNPDNTETGYYGNSVIDILEDSQGNFWIGKTNGLYLKDWDHGTLTSFTSAPDDPETLSDNSVTVIFEDSEQRLWVGTQNGLNLMDRETGTFTRFLDDPGNPHALNHPYIYTLFEDSRGNLWIGTRGGGLHRYREETGDFQRYLHDKNDLHSIGGNTVTAIVEDEEGRLWIGTEHNGLNLFEPESQRFYRYKSDTNDPASLSSNSILSLYISDQNLLWVGTFDGGVNVARLDQPPFEHYKPEVNKPNSLSHHAVLSFGEDHSGNIWVGTDGGGANRFDRSSKKFSTLRHDSGKQNSLSSDIVLDIFKGPGRELWFGTYHGGISVMDEETGTFKHYLHDPDDPTSLSNNEVWDIFRDSEGTIWVGTCSGGLNRFDEKTETFTRFMHDPDDPSSLLNNFIATIFEDSEGRLWIGTYGGGISLMNRKKGTFTHYTMSNSGLSDNVVSTMHEDRDGRFWIGTKGGGLNLFDVERNQFTVYTTSDGLPNNTIHGILEGQGGNLWLSTNNGLSKFNPEHKTFTNYNLSHGLQSREFKEGAHYQDEDGFLYFGGVNGFNRFRAERVRTSHEVPSIVLTDFRISNRPVEIGQDKPLKKQVNEADRIVVPYNASVLTYEYSALNFHFNKNSQYAYRLKGFENDWNYVGDQRSATYTNLDPGPYTFEVKTSNNDGVWSEKSAQLPLVVTPPFWQTTWFYLLSVLVIAGAVFGGYRYRVRKIRAQNRYLEQEVSTRTSELHEKNKALEAALIELRETKDELVEKAHKAGMADIASGVLHNVGNILNSVTTSAAFISKTTKNSKLSELLKANDILRENLDRIEEFIIEDPKGKLLLNYYLKLEEPLKNEQAKLVQQSKRLTDKIDLINEVIAAQQNFAGAQMDPGEILLEGIVDDTLALQAEMIDKHNLNVQKEIEPVDPIAAQRSKLIHILVNIFKNSKEAMAGLPPERKIISMKTWQDRKNVYLSISDQGRGIQNNHMEKIFTHGFTTKKKGHGFGLHSSANYIKEMGGEISVESEGEGQGATFILAFTKYANWDKRSQKQPAAGALHTTD